MRVSFIMLLPTGFGVINGSNDCNRAESLKLIRKTYKKASPVGGWYPIELLPAEFLRRGMDVSKYNRFQSVYRYHELVAVLLRKAPQQ